MREVVITSAVRTALGSFQGSLKNVTATELGKIVILKALERSGLTVANVDEVIMGNVLPAGLGQNPARQAMLKAGLPFTTGALTINKVCGSGLKAVMLAAQAVALGDADIIVAGGMENMTRAPYYLERAREGYRMGNNKILDGMVHDGLWDHNNNFHMGMSAELCAEKYGIDRAAQDELALRSYNLALASQKDGKFNAEIVPVTVKDKKKEIVFGADEIPRPTSMADLAKLAPAFKAGGSVTPGNSSKISDGAAALVLMPVETAQEAGIPALARIVAQASSGLDPRYVLVAPILAIPKVLKKAGMQINDIDLFEINEAFASSSAAVIKELQINPDKVNVHGGSIALGHPIGASGARVLVTLLYAMQEQNARRGLATLCLGGGEAVALVVERQ